MLHQQCYSLSLLTHPMRVLHCPLSVMKVVKRHYVYSFPMGVEMSFASHLSPIHESLVPHITCMFRCDGSKDGGGLPPLEVLVFPINNMDDFFLGLTPDQEEPYYKRNLQRAAHDGQSSRCRLVPASPSHIASCASSGLSWVHLTAVDLLSHEPRFGAS
jgi:hypothetical protein